ncbi:phage shock protein C (PspC) family protein [Bryocella elongata]|uniref:Phage shock protein C (PspC) family protein n=2 Tax=Bryocella elongata TaxID=863522 RepID=A0A1H5SME5_9BACT|nr:phage shock protein C (PspC) family protein [Bryocella elongata]
MTCNVCGKTMDSGVRFCSQCGATMNFQAVPPVQTRLYRPRQGRAIAGVCAGFALRYGWDVTLVRIALLLLVVFGCGSPIVAYLIAWIAMPNEPIGMPPYVMYAPAGGAPPMPPAPPAAPYSEQTGTNAS